MWAVTGQKEVELTMGYIKVEEDHREDSWGGNESRVSHNELEASWGGCLGLNIDC